MASGALSFAKENLLAMKFFPCRFLRVELSKHVELRRRREVQNFLKFSHIVNLAAAVQNVNSFLGCDDRVSGPWGTG